MNESKSAVPQIPIDLDWLSDVGNSCIIADVQSNGRGYFSGDSITPLASIDDIARLPSLPEPAPPAPASNPVAQSLALSPAPKIIHVHTSKCLPGCLSGTPCVARLCRGSVKSMKCMTGLCVKHCKLSGRCHLKDHKTTLPSLSAIPRDSAPALPPSSTALPTLTTTPSAPPHLASPVVPLTRTISQPATPALAALLDKQLAAERRVQQEKSDHTRMTDQSARAIMICFWPEDGARTLLQVQDISTFPSFNLATSTTSLDRARPSSCVGPTALLQHLDLSPADFVDVWCLVFDDWVCKPVDHVMQVTSQQMILVRRKGVVRCDKLDETLEQLRPSSSHANLSRHVSKRQYHDSLRRADERRSKTPRLEYFSTPAQSSASSHTSSTSNTSALDQSFTSDLSLTTSMLSDTSLALSASFITPSSSEMEAGAQAAMEAILSDRSARNLEMRVYVGLTDTWPNGMHVRDMVDAFKFERALKGERNLRRLPDRLRHIFEGVDVPVRNYLKQKAAWEHMSSEERSDARGKSSAREWTHWRKETNGWLYVCNKQK
ncbi:hypothetical protein HDZ31DRAFT_61629 [Schizophyllum fasciatum]